MKEEMIQTMHGMKGEGVLMLRSTTHAQLSMALIRRPHFAIRMATHFQIVQVHFRTCRFTILVVNITTTTTITPMSTNLDEGINVADGRNVLWDERLQLRLKLMHLGLVSDGCEWTHGRMIDKSGMHEKQMYD